MVEVSQHSFGLLPDLVKFSFSCSHGAQSVLPLMCRVQRRNFRGSKWDNVPLKRAVAPLKRAVAPSRGPLPPSGGPLPHLVSYIHILQSVFFNNIINHSFNYSIDYTNNKIKRDIRTPTQSVETVSCVL